MNATELYQEFTSVDAYDFILEMTGEVIEKTELTEFLNNLRDNPKQYNKGKIEPISIESILILEKDLKHRAILI